MDDEPSPLDATVVSSTTPVGQTRPVAWLAPGSQLGRYRIIGFLGAGAMGAVYRARDPELARDVALKQVFSSVAALDDTRARLRREAQAMARVDHPAVVGIYDVGVDEHQLFVAMELVEGGTVRDWLRTRKPAWREIARVFGAVARGLAAAHAAGLVHRDVKPENILIDGAGRARVSDFGLARGVGGDAEPAERRSRREILDVDLTATGGLVGTPAYMAPEQLDCADVTAAADQFSFAVALWEALWGVRPFAAAAAGEPGALRALRAAIARGPLEPPATPRGARSFAAVLRRALAEDPAQRWPAMTELADALARAARPQRTPWLVGGGLVGAAAAAVAALLLSHAGTRAPAPAPHDSPLRLATKRSLGPADPRASTVLLPDDQLARVDGDVIALSSLAGAVRERLPLPAHGSADTVTLAVSADRGLAVTFADPAGTHCAAWSLAVDQRRAPLRFWDGPCAHVALSPDGAAVAVADERGIEVRELGATARTRWTHAVVGFGYDVAWSPDGALLAAMSNGFTTLVLDAARGTELARAHGGLAVAWLDAHHLVHAAPVGGGRSELRLLELAPGAAADDTFVAALDAYTRGLQASSAGVLVTAESTDSAAYVLPADADAGSLDHTPRLDTGEEQDRETLAWTTAGEVLTRSARGDRQELMRTRPGAHGGTLVHAFPPGAVILVAATRDRAVWTQPLPDGGCLASTLDIATSTEHAISAAGLCDWHVVTCASAAARCLVRATNDDVFWLDLDTAEHSPAPRAIGDAPSIDSQLSADGRALAVLRPDGHLAILQTADGSAHELSPALGPDERPWRVMWSAAPDTLIVVTAISGTPPTFGLRLVSEAGSARAIATPSPSDLDGVIVSPDGRSIALTARSPHASYDYYPITARP